ncbi:MAG: BamA/TamA family outer membrane protein [Verrucomicrobiota bacterium]
MRVRLSSKLRHLFPSAVFCLGAGILFCQASAALWIPWQKKEPVAQPTLGEGVKVLFIGAKAFSEKKLRSAIDDQLRQIREEGLSNPNADDAAYYLSAFYQDNGYSGAEVNWEIKGKELRLTIQEGAQSHLRTITISGNSAIPTASLTAVLKSPTTDRLGRLQEKLPFVAEDLRRGCGRILDWYQAEGYLNAEITKLEPTPIPDSNEVDVFVEVSEGRLHRFGAIQFKGNKSFSDGILQKQIEQLTNLPYTAARVTNIQSVLQEFYSTNSYFDASVETTADPVNTTPDGRVPLVIQINSGSPYHFSGLDLNGLNGVKQSWMKARLLSLEGQPYNATALDNKTRPLMASGLFSSLQITPIPQQDHSILLKISSEAAKAKEIGFSGGYGSYEGMTLGIRASNRNLFSRGMQGGLELAVSQRTLGVEASFANPWLFETQTAFISRVFLRNRIEIGYEKREGGIRGELSRRILPNLLAAAYAQTKTVEITTSDFNSSFLGKSAYQVGTTGISATLDRRDDALHPTRGWIAAGLLDSNALQDGAAFLRTSARFGWHYPLPAGINFAASARFGLLSQETPPPIDERYFLGGATTVRSFRERQLGPHDPNNNPIGGGAYSLANVEADFPLWQNLRGAIFWDSGSLSPKGKQIPLADFRSALGIGIRYNLPVGPLRLDVGFNPDRKSNESWGAAHLSFGFAF